MSISHSLVIGIANELKLVAHFIERKNGDLIIIPNRAEFHREITNLPSGLESRIDQQKYSIHRSLNSREKINAITHEYILSDRAIKKTLHYTKAVKQYNQFAPIFLAQCPDLSNDRYTFGENNSSTLIDNFVPSKSTFFYMLVVGSVERSLTNNSRSDIRVKTIELTHFNVSIFWSFAMLPSNETGQKVHFLTLDPKEQSPYINVSEMLSRGWSEGEAINQFRKIRKQALLNLIKIIGQQYPNIRKDLARLPYSFSESPSYHQFLYPDITGWFSCFEDMWKNFDNKNCP